MFLIIFQLHYIKNVNTENQAKDSGIIRGDILVNVDGTDTKGLSPEEVAAIIRYDIMHFWCMSGLEIVLL